MGVFPRFDREELDPGPPRKTGLPRLWELIARDFWDNFRAGFLALAGCIPFMSGLFLAASVHSMPLAPLMGLIGGAVAGPELCALADILLRGLRDDIGRVFWPTYRRAWRRSAGASLLPALFLICPGLDGAFQIEERSRGRGTPPEDFGS